MTISMIWLDICEKSRPLSVSISLGLCALKQSFCQILATITNATIITSLATTSLPIPTLCRRRHQPHEIDASQIWFCGPGSSVVSLSRGRGGCARSSAAGVAPVQQSASSSGRRSCASTRTHVQHPCQLHRCQVDERWPGRVLSHVLDPQCRGLVLISADPARVRSVGCVRALALYECAHLHAHFVADQRSGCALVPGVRSSGSGECAGACHLRAPCTQGVHAGVQFR